MWHKQDMDLKRLRTFVTIAEQGSISKAAVLLRIAQPALSRQIADLEKELGLLLFHRIGRRVFLTGEGEQLLDHCRSLLGHATLVTEQAQILRGGDAGTLRVAAPPITIESILSTFLPRYSLRYPKVRVKLIESVGTNTLGMLERGEIHLSISVLDDVRHNGRHLGFYPVPPTELWAAFPRALKLPTGDAIDIGRIASYPLLLLDSGYTARKRFDAICHLAKLKPEVLIESRAPHTLLALAEAGLGIAIVPSTMRTYRYKVRISRITYMGKALSVPIGIAWDRRRPLTRYAKEFCELLAAHMSELSPIAHAKPGAAAPATPARRAKTQGRPRGSVR
jgi:DNA-binding transcriptional LysR family regulator